MKLIRTAILFALSLVSAPALAHTITVSWTPSTTPNTTTELFRIQCSTAQDTKQSVKPNATCTGTTTKIASGLTVSPYIDSTVQPGFSYEYYAKAVDTTNTESVQSNTTVGTVAPSAATNVTIGSHN